MTNFNSTHSWLLREARSQAKFCRDLAAINVGSFAEHWLARAEHWEREAARWERQLAVQALEEALGC